MGNKIGRNDKCPCGSDKKYKKCCEGKLRKQQNLESQVSGKNIVNTIFKGEMISKKPEFFGDKVLFMPSYKSLDDDCDELGLEPLIPRLEKMKKETPFPVWTNCHANAHGICLFDNMEDVIPVSGWYGNLESYLPSPQDIPNNWRQLGQKEDERWYDDKEREIYDLKENISWTHHSWNVALGRSKKYGDVHFDMGTEMFKGWLSNFNTKYNWFYYIETYRPENYYKNRDYIDLVRSNDEIRKNWLSICKSRAFKFVYENSTTDYMGRTEYWGYDGKEFQPSKQKLEKLNKELIEGYKDYFLNDFPMAGVLYRSNPELRIQIEDLVFEFFCYETFRTENQLQHQLLDRFFPDYDWKIYLQGHILHENWKMSPYRNK